MIYLVCFAISSFFAHIASKSSLRKNAILVVFFSLLSILCLAILGGCRSIDLGTDVTVYVVSHFKHAKTINNVLEYLTTYNTQTGREPLYRLIVYLSSRGNTTIYSLLFALQFLTISCIYVGAYKHRKEVPIALSLLLWCLFYYNDSYNMVRQHLAMAIVFLFIDKLEADNYVMFAVGIILAAMIHTTAILAFALIAVKIVASRGKREYRSVQRMCLIICLLVGVLLFETVVIFAVKLGILSNRYLYYFAHESVSDNNFQNLIYIVELLVVVLCAPIIRNKDKTFHFYEMNLFTTFITLQFARIMYYGNRISLYFGIINLLLIGKIPYITNRKKSKMLIKMGLVGVGLLYWWYVYIHGGASATYPYKLGVI